MTVKSIPKLVFQSILNEMVSLFHEANHNFCETPEKMAGDCRSLDGIWAQHCHNGEKQPNKSECQDYRKAF